MPMKRSYGSRWMESATVKVGPFARGGKSRVPTKAADHDFEAVATVTPVGILLPQTAELFLYAVASRVTSDCLVDRLADWGERVKDRFPSVKTLLINLDHGPEHHRRRTQFMRGFQRQTAFVSDECLQAPTHRVLCVLALQAQTHDLYRS